MGNLVLGRALRSVTGSLMVGAFSYCATSTVAMAQPRPFEISAGAAPTALGEFARQAKLQTLFDFQVLKNLHTQAVTGDYEPEAALKRMLAGTGLTFELVDTHTVAIHAAGLDRAAAEQGQGQGQGGDMISNAPENESADNSFWQKFKLTQADDKASGRDSANGAEAGKAFGTLEEVIVTAQKREENLQDVPVPVTVLSGEVLTQSNQLRLQDYFQAVPGLSFTLGGDSSTPALSIRGITNGGGGIPTVGIVIDDIPYGSTTGLGGRGQPDIDPGDLARVEVLRGPQGTLYGANSMGGLLKFVTIDPSMDRLSGRIETGVSSLFNGANPGYNVRGSINVPVNETIAVRASAFREVNGGYIDNIQTGEHGVNRRSSEGGRVSGLWKPSDALSLRLSALIQESKLDGPAQATTGTGYSDLQTIALPNTWNNEEKTQAYSATLKANFGGVEFTSLTGYNIDKIHFVDDFTPAFGGVYSFISSIYSGTPGSIEIGSIETRRFSQELRLSIPLGERLDWLLGGFYTDEKDELNNDNDGTDPVTGIPTGSPAATPPLGATWLRVKNRLSYKEYAAFTNLTYNFTDQFTVQAGGRFSNNKQTFDSFRSGGAATDFFGRDSLAVTGVRSDESPVTYLLTPQYKVSPDLMIYARVASGYRPGGPNIACGENIPECTFKAEKTKNYELGLKGNALDHVISFDASLYYIDWTDIVVGLPAGPTGLTHNGNEGGARSQGAELSMEARPLQGLTVSAWIAWNDAKFTTKPPPILGGAVAQPGDRIPFTSRISGHLSVDEEFIVSGPLTAFVGGALSYVGDRVGGVQPPGTARADLPGYAQTDLRTGLKYDTWTFSAYVNNVTDKRGALAGGIDGYALYPNATTYVYIQPRTFGLNATKAF